MYKDITGIILSGGKSTRMGVNKSFLELGGKTVIEQTIDMMKSLFERVILITNEPDLYKEFDVDVFTDIYTYKGPLAGIHSGLINSTTEKNFIISCDMPLVTEDIIEFIIDYPCDRFIKITRADGFVQQLCGYYSKSCLPAVEEIFANSLEEETRHKEQKKRKCNVLKLVESIDGCIIDIEKEYAEYKEGSFLNMNRPEEYEQILSMFKQKNNSKIK